MRMRFPFFPSWRAIPKPIPLLASNECDPGLAQMFGAAVLSRMMRLVVSFLTQVVLKKFCSAPGPNPDVRPLAVLH